MLLFVGIRGRLLIVANRTEDAKEGDWLRGEPATRGENDNYFDHVYDAKDEVV